MTDLDERLGLIRHRQRNFKVKVSKADESWRMFKDEITLSVTHNGNQWQAITLTQIEAEKVYTALAKHFGWPGNFK